MIRAAAAVIYLACVLGSTPAGAINTTSDPRSRADASSRQFVECIPALADRCPQSALFRQLPELMTPSDSVDPGSQPLESLPYRELELLPQPMIVPVPAPNVGDILIDRRPGGPG